MLAGWAAFEAFSASTARADAPVPVALRQQPVAGGRGAASDPPAHASGSGGGATVAVAGKRRGAAPARPSRSLDAIRAEMQRVDTTPAYKKMGAWHNSLRGDGLVEDMELYTDARDQSVAGAIRLGCSLCGHKGIIHGGITAMAFDDLFGTCFYTQVKRDLKGKADAAPAAFTANLDVNYRTPLPCGTRVIFNAKIDRIEGRKIFMSGTATNATGQVRYADATALFITPRKTEEPGKK